MVMSVILIRLLFFLMVVKGAPQGLGNAFDDGAHYTKLAESILTEGTYGIRYGQELWKDYFRPPGYPLFLAIVFGLTKHSFVAVILLQIVLSGLTALGIIRLAQLLFPNSRYTYLAGIFFAIEPNSIAFCTYISSETLFTTCWIWALTLFVRAIQQKKTFYLYLSALVFVAALYTRPIAQYALYIACVVLVIYTIKKYFRVSQSLVFGILIFGLPSLWSWRNYTQSGHFTFTAQKGSQALFFYCASVEQHRTGQGFEETQILFFNRYPTQYMRTHHIVATDSTNLLQLTTNITFEDDLIYQKEAKNYLKTHFRSFLFSMVKGTIYQLFGVGNWTWENYLGTLEKRGLKQVFDHTQPSNFLTTQFIRSTWQQSLFRILHFCFLLILYGWVGYTIIKQPFSWITLYLGINIVYLMVLVAIVMENRYRIPIMVILCAFCGQLPKRHNPNPIS